LRGTSVREAEELNPEIFTSGCVLDSAFCTPPIAGKSGSQGPVELVRFCRMGPVQPNVVPRSERLRRRDPKGNSVDGLGAVSGSSQMDRLRLPNVVSIQPTKLLFYSLGSS
jgi:hypothetical protein